MHGNRRGERHHRSRSLGLEVGEEQLFYLMSRGMTESEATAMVVNGFIEPIVKTLPMDYAIEMNRLVQLQMACAIG